MKENRIKLSITIILEESIKAIENPNRVLQDCSFGHVVIDQIDIFIPEYNAINMPFILLFYPYFIVNKIAKYTQGRKIRNLLYGQCQRLYGSISVLSKQENQSKERLEYLNYMKSVLEHSIQYLESK